MKSVLTPVPSPPAEPTATPAEGSGYRLAQILMAIMEEEGVDLWPEPEVIVALADPAPPARCRRHRRRRP